jgi:dTDP-4-dehydrorhamnose reductase
MLGHDVARAGERAGHDLIPLDRMGLDITDPMAVRSAVKRCAPEAIVNCAAWTDVDGAETHREDARAVNGTAAGNVARAAAAEGIPMVHVSTDYVFSGAPPLDAKGERRAYVESDPTGPRSVYGQTKLEGERLVMESSPLHTVVRSSWLFGVGATNFVDTMMRLAGERETVRVVDDQAGCPTWTGHLAPALLGLLEREVRGLVHLAGGGFVTWRGFAKEIFRQAELGCLVEAASTEEMGRAAPRPAWSAIESERHDVLAMPDWRRA